MTDEDTIVRTGGCLCSQVRFEVRGAPMIVGHCHCEQCRRGSGAGHSTAAVFAVGQVSLTGDLAEHRYVSDNGNEVVRRFCPACGSPIAGSNSAMKGFMSLTLGTFDDAADLTPQVAIFARSRLPWDHIAGDVRSFDAQPTWHPDDET